MLAFCGKELHQSCSFKVNYSDALQAACLDRTIVQVPLCNQLSLNAVDVVAMLVPLFLNDDLQHVLCQLSQEASKATDAQPISCIIGGTECLLDCLIQILLQKQSADQLASDLSKSVTIACLGYCSS